ncbi:hypothetical protein Tco_1357016 [Tanacetum coccineum]
MPRTIGTHDDDARSTRFKRSRQYETVEEVMLPHVHHMFLLWEGCNQAANSRYNTKLAQLLPRLIYSPCVVDWNVLNQMSYGEAIDEMLMIKLFVASTTKEIFTSQAWTNAFTLMSQFIVSFAMSSILPTSSIKFFAKRLGLYNSKEIEEEGFDVYFQDGLRSDEHFNAQEHQNGYVNVAWLIARWMKMKGAGSQKESMICCGQCITKISKRKNLLSKEDLYERVGNMEIRQGAIERMSYRQSYHWDRYAGVFEHMAKVYSVPLPGSYNPPGYDQ